MKTRKQKPRRNSTRKGGSREEEVCSRRSLALAELVAVPCCESDLLISIKATCEGRFACFFFQDFLKTVLSVSQYYLYYQ